MPAPAASSTVGGFETPSNTAASPVVPLSATGSSTTAATCRPTSSTAVRFTADQVMCLCEALQQAGDLDRLARFISSLGPGELVAGGESVLRARAAVAFHQGKYAELFGLLEGNQFDAAGHQALQQMWYRAHYAEAEKARAELGDDLNKRTGSGCREPGRLANHKI